MRAAIVATVRNEALSLPELLASLERQSRVPDVIVVTDGGSTDGTQKILADFASDTSLPLRWLEVPGNRSRGRNAGITAADADLIAITDASIPEPRWFERIIAPLEAGTADLVAGWYELRPDSSRERCIGLLTQYSLDQVQEATFLPSSRSVAFTRDLWERAGRYPEAYSGNEDTVFDLAIERLRPRKVFVRDAVVQWRPAGSLRQVFRQYKKYAVGDGQAGIFLTTHTRYAAYSVVYAVGIALLLAGLFWWPSWILASGLATGYFAARIRKVMRAKSWSQIPYAVVVVLAWDLSRIVGYAQGRVDRLRRGAAHFRF